MASSSSAKKVARVAAKSGPKSPSQKGRSWLFPAAIAGVVLLGVGVVAYAVNQHSGVSSNTTPPRAQLSQGAAGDHWHAAFAINVCGKELPALQDAQADVLGIHTHGDGLAHIHPFSLRAAGKNATLGRFFDQTGTKVTNDGFKLSDGKVYLAGKTTCGGKPTELVMAHWKNALEAGTKPPTNIFTSDFNGVRFTEDHGAFTLAMVAKGTRDIPAPSSAAQIEQLGSADASPSAGTSGPSGTSGTSGTGG